VVESAASIRRARMKSLFYGGLAITIAAPSFSDL
jgi:hypothetical protein